MDRQNSLLQAIGFLNTPQCALANPAWAWSELP